MMDTLTNLDRMLLRCYYIFKSIGREDAQPAIDNVKRQAIYTARQYRHNVDASRIKVPESDVEKRVWVEFIREEVKNGKTTAVIAEEQAIPLEKVNSYLM